MAKPTKLELSEKDVTKITSMFKGTKTVPGIKNARTIAAKLELPRYQVMYALEKSKLAKFAVGSYN